MKSDVSHVLFVGLSLCCVAPVAALARVESDVVREEQGVEADAGVQGVIDIAGDMTAASVEIDPVPIGTVVELWDVKGAFITEASYGDLSYDSNDASEISLTLRFDNCVLQY